MRKKLTGIQSFMIVDALVEYVKENGGELRVGDEFTCSIRGIKGIMPNDSPVSVKFCDVEMDVYTRTPGTGNKRHNTEEDNVSVPMNLFMVGEYDLNNVIVKVNARGMELLSSDETTAYVRCGTDMQF